MDACVVKRQVIIKIRRKLLKVRERERRRDGETERLTFESYLYEIHCIIAITNIGRVNNEETNIEIFPFGQSFHTLRAKYCVNTQINIQIKNSNKFRVEWKDS